MPKIDGARVNLRLTETVGANLAATLEPAAFLSYAQVHPWLINVLAAARNHGEIKSAMLEANGFPDPKEFSTRKKDRLSAFLDLGSELQELAIWLVSAGRIFGIHVLGFSIDKPQGETINRPKTLGRKTKTPNQPPEIIFREGSKRQKIDQRLQEKKGVGLIAYITMRYQGGENPNVIDREITKITRVRWSVGNTRDIIVTNKIHR